MKRRVKASDEWVDLIQAENSDDDNIGTPKGNKNRNSNVRCKVLAMMLFLTTLTFLVSVMYGDGTKATRKRINLAFHGGKRRNRKVILLGPHDRYNDFGDILAERVITKLLVDRAGFVYNATDDESNTLLLGGIVTRNDMDNHGLTAHKTVYSMKTIQEMSRKDEKMGPYDIVFTGGSGDGPGDEGPAILYEKHKEAVDMLETVALRNSAVADRKWDCPYLFPKELLLPIVNKTLGTNVRIHKTGSTITLPRPRKNYAIVDSLETPPLKGKDKEQEGPPFACRRVTAKADHLGLRGSKPFAPESLIMTKELLATEIDEVYETQVRQELLDFPEFSEELPMRYIAVQHETAKQMSNPSYAQELADALDEVSRKLDNAPVVFFPAGRVGRSVGDHIAFGLSREVSEKMKQPSVLYETEHALKVAALVQGAQAVISTNLHVYILSFVYQKPRAMLYGGKNHEKFMTMWEAKDVKLKGIVSSVQDIWGNALERFFVDGGFSNPMITQSKTEAASQSARRHYLKNFETWSTLLTTPLGDGEDDDSVVR